VARLKDVTWRQVLVAAGALAAIGVTISLDQDIRNSAVGIGSKTARDIQTAATTASWVSLGALYAAGLWAGRDDWRHHALTGDESALVSAQLVSLTKEAFGRQRPNANKGADRWWDNGDSFVSDAATQPFAIAEAVSDAFEHRWWVTAPAYAAASAVGVGRMDQDDHWASDIVGSAVLGIASRLSSRRFTKMSGSHQPQRLPRLATKRRLRRLSRTDFLERLTFGKQTNLAAPADARASSLLSTSAPCSA
jgi:membrane-associated phospholipid phosphatase